MKITNDDLRGGSGRGQGRKPKYNEPTTTLSKRVPISKKKALSNLLNRELMKYEIGGATPAKTKSLRQATKK